MNYRHQSVYLKEVGKQDLKVLGTESSKTRLQIGILALQGGFDLHRSFFEKESPETRLIEVKKREDLSGCDGLILPGGESGTILRLIAYQTGFWDDLKKFCQARPSWGICAGSILLAKEVKNPEQISFEIIPILAERNAYGRQKESRKVEFSYLAPELFEPKSLGLKSEGSSPQAIFIRAPKLTPLPAYSLKPLAKVNDEAVAFHHDMCMVSSFHPELGTNQLFHRYFLKMCSITVKANL